MRWHRWQSDLEHKLRTVIGDGDISQLPGAGAPLAPDPVAKSPAELRMAHKIMQDNDVLPAWIATGTELRAADAQLRQVLDASLERSRSAHQSALSVQALRQCEAAWARTAASWRERATQHNREVLAHNLTLPRGIAQLDPLPIDRLMQAARRALRAR